MGSDIFRLLICTLCLSVCLPLFFCSAAGPCPEGDLDGNCTVDCGDLAILSGQWLNGSGCEGEPNCADLDGIDGVRMRDFAILAADWYRGDLEPKISEFMASNGRTLEDGGGNYPDWIEIHNVHPSERLELGGWYLTDEASCLTKWRFPDGTTVEPGGYLVVFASGKDEPNYVDSAGYLHTTFKLDKDGEYLALVDPNGSRVVHEYAPYFPQQQRDISYGLYNRQQRYFSEPSPGRQNSGAFIGFVGDTIFSPGRGFYDAPVMVEIHCNTPGARIRYTLDGSTPTEVSGFDYDSPVTISRTTCLRAAAFKPGWMSSRVNTQTYIFVDDVVMQSPGGEPPGPGWPADGLNGQKLDYGMDPNVVDDPRWCDLMDDALLGLPTISLVTDLGNLFDPDSGIYVNAGQRGRAWERPVSVELIYPDGTEGFQVDAGLRIRGGTSRSHSNPKHAFRLHFRSEYGPAKLHFPLFGDEGVTEFDTIDLRTTQHFSWSWKASSRCTMNRDVFSRDLQRELGQPYTRSRYCHLYINGQYWGIYQTQERADASYAESYFGGDEEDYDVIKVYSADWPTNVHVVAVDGDIEAYRQLWEIARYEGFSSAQSYYKAQGLNPDRTRNSDYPVLLDVDNLIVYMLSTYYSGDWDGPIGWGRPRNFYAIRSRNAEQGFKFFRHDCEWTLLDLEDDRTEPSYVGEDFSEFNPLWLHLRLCENPDYRMRFADIVHAEFHNNGVFYVDPDEPVWQSSRRLCNRPADLFMSRAEQIETAIIAESARWGDAKRDPALGPFTRADWQAEIDRLIHEYFPYRTEIVLQQFKDRGWYPDQAVAPQFTVNGVRQHGGLIEPGDELGIESPAGGTVYYSLDGADPRLPGGAINPAASIYSGPIALTATTCVTARLLKDGQWSALAEALFCLAGECD